ncbi:MAG: integral rane sensor signal transduction histidine kinase [Bryobacterales bacterium]|nr:integral rane sensor signal transduction histidine kinase [Bryobacterales bacterium]
MTLIAVGVYSSYTFVQLGTLRELQTETIDRNRRDTLLLLRIQNGLNSVALAMRDMLDTEAISEGPAYPMVAWKPQFRRLRTDLEDALAQERKVSVRDRTSGQEAYLHESFRQFWDALDRVFERSEIDEAEARTAIRLSLQARHAAISTAVARLLVQNNESEQAAASRTRQIYAGVQTNVYVFLAAMLIVIVLTSLYVVQYNRRMFHQVEQFSDQRSELAQQLIGMQENAFAAISRELHDDFGQILTAIGVMLQRADRKAGDLMEVREVVQATLDKVRTLSRALHPVVLDEVGLEGAFDDYLPGFEKRTGIEIHYQKKGEPRELDRDVTIHLYRVMQEALNNVAKHSGSKTARVRLEYGRETVTLEIADRGRGLGKTRGGLGMVSMRERAGMVHGNIEFLEPEQGGTLVRVTVPVLARETVRVEHAE